MSNTNSNSKSKAKTNSRTKTSSRKKTSNSKQKVDRMKYEIASEFGVNLGADSTARANGSVGGEITKRLVQSGMNNVNNSYQNKN